MTKGELQKRFPLFKKKYTATELKKINELVEGNNREWANKVEHAYRS